MSLLLRGGEELLQGSHRNQEVNTLGRSRYMLMTLHQWLHP